MLVYKRDRSSTIVLYQLMLSADCWVPAPFSTPIQMCRADSGGSQADDDATFNGGESELELQVRELAELLTDKNQEIERLQAVGQELDAERQQVQEERRQLESERAAFEAEKCGRGQSDIGTSAGGQTQAVLEAAARQLGEGSTEQLDEDNTGTEDTTGPLLTAAEHHVRLLEEEIGRLKNQEQVRLDFGSALCTGIFLADMTLKLNTTNVPVVIYDFFNGYGTEIFLVVLH